MLQSSPRARSRRSRDAAAAALVLVADVPECRSPPAPRPTPATAAAAAPAALAAALLQIRLGSSFPAAFRGSFCGAGSFAAAASGAGVQPLWALPAAAALLLLLRSCLGSLSWLASSLSPTTAQLVHKGFCDALAARCWLCLLLLQHLHYDPPALRQK